MPAAREAIVIGAGLAGAAAALALAEQGLAVTVVDAASAPAAGASGNPAALVRGLVSRDDGAHARWHRAAALEAQSQLGPWIAAGHVEGRLGGVLHLDDAAGSGVRLARSSHSADLDRTDRANRTERTGRPAHSARAGVERGAAHEAAHGVARGATPPPTAWPSNYVQWLEREAASAQAGLPLRGPAWFFPGGGHVDPAGLVHHMLRISGAVLRLGCSVATLQRRGTRWLACGASGAPWAEADVVVLANAAGAARLAPPASAAAWALVTSRGQVTLLRAHAGAAGLAMPLARNGYVIPLPQGRVLCGATQTAEPMPPPRDGVEPIAAPQGDDSTHAGTWSALRQADHAHNLAIFGRLTGQRTLGSAATSIAAGFDPAHLEGRVGWRCHTDDRLPLVGAVAADDGPAASPSAAPSRATRLAQPRHVPRESGLYVLTALGSRGVTGAMLGARVLAAWAADAPLPIDTDLLDAVDAARHLARAVRRGAGSASGASGAGSTSGAPSNER